MTLREWWEGPADAWGYLIAVLIVLIGILLGFLVAG